VIHSQAEMKKVCKDVFLPELKQSLQLLYKQFSIKYDLL